MPFPAFFPLDYEVGRTKAWLEALNMAKRYLPANASSWLWDLDLDTDLGQIALAALLNNISVVTPDISSSRQIDVFLDGPADPSLKAAELFEQPELFLIQLSLMLDMQNILQQIEELRPENTAEAEKLNPKLDPLVKGLEYIWDLSRFLRAGELELPDILPLQAEDLPIQGLLLASKQKLAAKEYYNALMLTESALRQLEKTGREQDPVVVRKYLQGKAFYLRALAHWRQQQLALAEKDLQRGAKLLDETGLPLKLRSQIYLDWGDLKKFKNDLPGMCMAYQEACARGECGALAASRREGYCQEKHESANSS